MSLCLAIETSSGAYSVALGENDQVRFDSTDRKCTRSSRDLAWLVGYGLESIGASYRDIKAIGVNIGPGGLSSTRAGVSFANGLAFSLQIPLYAFSYFEIVARQIPRSEELATLCVVPAAAGNAYIALAANGVRISRFGPFEPTLSAAVTASADIAVAGRLRERVANLLPHCRIFDTGIDAPDVSVLLQMTQSKLRESAQSVTQAVPLNETAEDFRA
jgi:tRNA threonylcarbamoyladenosine biosynthesis protein TsaB